VYHEGGDSYRPFLVLPSTDPSWPLPACTFYQSSGRSNDALNGIYTGSWLPTGGLDETGHIIKLQTYSNNQLLPWAFDLFESFFDEALLEANTYARTQSLRTLLRENRPLYDKWKELAAQCQQIYQFVQYYFLFDWQLRTSAQIGGGFWDRVPTFRQHVMQHVAAAACPIPASLPSEGVAQGEEAPAVRAFLMEHHANMTPEAEMQLSASLVVGDDDKRRKKWGGLSLLLVYFTKAEEQQAKVDAALRKMGRPTPL